MSTDRQKKLLDYVIKYYSENGQAIGSKQIQKDFLKDVSSATIRNDLLTLEKKGMLEKSHISSGRMPTQKALNHFFKNSTNENLELFNNYLKNTVKLKNNDIKKSLEIITDITKQAALFVKDNNVKVIDLKYIELNKEQLILILVTSSGDVINETFNISQNDLNSVIKVLNIVRNNILGTKINQVEEIINNKVKLKINFFNDNLEYILQAIIKIINNLLKNNALLIGEKNIIENTQDINQLKEIFNLLNDTNSVINDSGDDIKHFIDNKKNLSKVVTKIKNKNESGYISIIGTNNMNHIEINQMLKELKAKENKDEN